MIAFLRRLFAPRRYDTTLPAPACPDCDMPLVFKLIVIRERDPGETHACPMPYYLSGRCGCGGRLDIWPDGRRVS